MNSTHNLPLSDTDTKPAPPQKRGSMHGNRFTKILFILLCAISLCPCVGTAIALAAGIIFSLVLANPFPKRTSTLSKILLQISVVGLGFGIGITEVIQEGKHSIVYTLIGITLTLFIGRLLGKLFKINSNISQLISFGTAICGGSAIAAMAPIIKAKDDEIAISLATVFTLNSVALLLFPFIGHLVHMKPESFGLWAALAIHDTSSVVGAAASFGVTALAIATTVKLTRALWIAPIALGISFLKKSNQKVTFPLFIIGFVLATLIRSLLPDAHIVWDAIACGARRLLVTTLFLIGSGLTRDVVRKVGLRPMLQGVTLWILVSITTFIIIAKGIIP